jgi:hypothetical protein
MELPVAARLMPAPAGARHARAALLLRFAF